MTPPPKPGGKTGLARILAATRYSFLGLRAAIRHEEAFRQELAVSVGLGSAAVILARSQLEFVVLMTPVVLMLVVELLNSAIEAIVDRVSAEHHELSGRAKDMGSAAVFLTVLFTVVVWAFFLVDLIR